MFHNIEGQDLQELAEKQRKSFIPRNFIDYLMLKVADGWEKDLKAAIYGGDSLLEKLRVVKSGQTTQDLDTKRRGFADAIKGQLSVLDSRDSLDPPLREKREWFREVHEGAEALIEKGPAWDVLLAIWDPGLRLSLVLSLVRNEELLQCVTTIPLKASSRSPPGSVALERTH